MHNIEEREHPPNILDNFLSISSLAYAPKTKETSIIVYKFKTFACLNKTFSYWKFRDKIVACFKHRTNAILVPLWHERLIQSLSVTWLKLQYFLKAWLLSSKKVDFIFFNETPLKMMNNAFYFILKALFFLTICTVHLSFAVHFIKINRSFFMKPLF